LSALELPDNPTLGQEYTHEGVIWKCDEDTLPIWSQKNPDYLKIDGSKAMIGQLQITPTIPTADNHAVRKDYADKVSEIITALSKEININSLVDVFIYDSNGDTDTTWIDSTSIAYPSVTIFTLSTTILTIYNANSYDLTEVATINTNGAKSVVAHNGFIYIGSTTGLKSYEIALDYAEVDLTSRLIAATVNDLAVTIELSGDDSGKTIIGVATPAGVTILNSNATEIDITATTYIGNEFIEFDVNNKVYITASDLVILRYDSIPIVNTVDGWNVLYGNLNETPALVIDPELTGIQDVNTCKLTLDSMIAIGYPNHLTLLKEDSIESDGMVHFVASDYASGWQKGDIQGAWLSSTDSRNLIDTERVQNPAFTSLDSWIKDGLGTLALDTQRLLVTNDGTGSDRTLAWQAVAVEVGKKYRVAIDGTDSSIAATMRIRSGTDINAGVIFYDAGVGTDFFYDFVATETSVTISLRGTDNTASGTSYYDNVSLTDVDIDRSYQSINLKVFGTITRPEANTGTELRAYDNFSASNYLQQTDTRFADTLFTYGWVKDAVNGWEFKHGVVNSNPIDGLTIAGDVLKIAGSLPKALIRLGPELSESQLTYVEETEQVLFLANNKCTLQGNLNAVNALGHAQDINILTVCVSDSTTEFNTLNVISNSTDINTSVYQSCGGKKVVGS